MKVFPSTWPSSRSPCLNASSKWAWAAWVAGASHPIFAIVGACPLVASGASVRLTARMTTSPISRMRHLGRVAAGESSRRPLIAGVGRVGRARLFDHLVRPQQQRLRDRQSQRLRRLEVDHQVELRGLFYWEVIGLRTL